MKIMLLFLLLLVSISPCDAQSTCALPLNEAPILFGLKLGMTEEEVRNVIGKELKFKPKKKNGERVFFQNFIKNPPPAILPEVRAIYLRFFHRRLYQIEIFYENRKDWLTLDEFTNFLSINNNFSNAFWTNLKNKFELQCAGFTLVADKVLNPRIELTDEASRARLEEARKKQRKQ